MKYLLVSSLILSLSLFGFSTIINRKTTPLSNEKFTGATPRFTTDHRGHPVLSWVEKDGDKGHFYLAISENGGQTFGKKIRINAPTELTVHAEGMPRVAFKADGSIWATFEIKKPTKEAPRASDLMYVVSTDKGQSWSAPKAVHKDTTPGKGHSFSDMVRLPNGELGFVWLDEKMGKHEGRSVKFTQTLPQGGFSEEVVVDSNACQCCRTVLFVDANKNIHLTYRDLLADGTRDMSHAVSTDGGKTFTQPQLVYKDRWKINACPHTGPSMTQSGNDFFVTWFSGKSENHEAGIRIVKLGEEKLISANLTVRAKHPQIANWNGNVAVVWDESVEKDGEFFTKIALRIIDKNGKETTTFLTADHENASYPVLLPTPNGLLLAYEWQAKDAEKAVIVSQWVGNL
ncbi:exo-alpha-sialidase [Runella salmonicolor]|uniref:Exo-alpha-sialidase n=1 Tax=Runella salmonicolor TaxID=2950278 RepID=A0ABT1FLR8_9BACT|nr:exo-alpha-sialidase [Runella salmonicolor]MCP1382710.1 exo-alpha-sialidase [Runella salmonicolor]